MTLLSGVVLSQNHQHTEEEVDEKEERWCASHEVMVRQMESNIEFINNMNMLDSYTPMFDYRSRDINIPVIVHVVYNTEEEIPTEEDIKAQIDGLTKDFNMGNADIDKLDEKFEGFKANLQITFKLATVDPDGNRTNGITYTKTDEPYFTRFDDVKTNKTGGKLGWNSNKYLNIWVCDLQYGLLGYAQFPGGSFITDGVVIDYKYFGINQVALLEMEAELEDGEDTVSEKPYFRVLTHEVGHWVGLRHIWGDAICGDDKVDDTPYQIQPHWDCTDSSRTCGSDDLTTNFMDYVPDDCMVMFTEGQKKRAWKALKMFRKEMLKRRNEKLCE